MIRVIYTDVFGSEGAPATCECRQQPGRKKAYYGFETKTGSRFKIIYAIVRMI